MSSSLSVGEDQICLLPGLWAPVSRENGVSCAMSIKFRLGGKRQTAVIMYLHIGTSGPSFGSARSIVGASRGFSWQRSEAGDRFPRNGAGPHDKRVIAKGGFDDELGRPGDGSGGPAW